MDNLPTPRKAASKPNTPILTRRRAPPKSIAALKREAKVKLSQTGTPPLKPSPQTSASSSGRASPIIVVPPVVMAATDLGGESALRLKVFTGTGDVKEFFKRFEIAKRLFGYLCIYRVLQWPTMTR